MNIAYIDWGGTNFRCVVEEGSKSSSYTKPSGEIDIISELQELFKLHPKISKIGISFAGQTKDNKILSAPNIQTKELDLNKIFDYKKEFVVENDLKCALLAEAEYFGEQNIAVIYVGTGIGSAYMDGGRIIRGFLNSAGEIGHIPYIKTDTICGCGKNNCLELTASGSGLAKKAAAIGIDFENLSKLKENNTFAEAVEDFENGIGYAVSLVISMLNPKMVVLGGGVVAANPYLLETTKKYVAKNAFAYNAKECEIKPSKLKDGSLAGAKLLLKRESF